MPSAAFWRQQQPRRYDYLIEELVAAGSVVTVADAMAQLDKRKRRLLRNWTCPAYSVRLVAAKAGRCRRWRLLCPACERRCEALFRVPGDDAAGWRCRICSRLQYSSRRHGRQHPSRLVPTPRQRIIARRRYEGECRLVKAAAKVNAWWATNPHELLERMAQVVAANERESARAAAWLREQLRGPRRVVAPVPPEITRHSLAPDVLETLQRLNAATV